MLTKKIKTNLLTKRPCSDYEDMLVELVTSKYEQKDVSDARDFFLKDFSAPFLKYIATNIVKVEPDDILSDYYLFISSAGGKDLKPYYKVSLFKRNNDACLQSYVSTITTRHFVDLQKKEIKKNPLAHSVEIPGSSSSDENSEKHVIDLVWFELLLADNAITFSGNDTKLINRVNTALSKLSYREQLIIKFTVMDDMPLIDAFDELIPYIAPQRPLEAIDRKDRQTAMSVLKGRALENLRNEFYKLVKDENTNNRR